MKRLIAISLALLSASVGRAEEIPLDQIWAYRMPGTQPMSDSLKSDEEPPPEREFLLDIRRSLNYDPERKVARKGFAVEGVGMDALRQAHQVLTAGAKPKNSFPEGTPISLVFFSYEFGSSVHIRDITRTNQEVKIQYGFVPHESQQSTEHFAIIPLGELRAGEYRVVIENAPLEKKYVEAGYKPVSAEYAEKIVCRPFSFVIE